ncbi:helix-turn-helix transcriptional regulator [Streptomyces sp. NPDC089799]|uniref:helix-turn-helix domain-containing protein n=1 Tax=Streptomyces sp. NPDC089799 TaxID=3155066 RepID=UPI0034492CBC
MQHGPAVRRRKLGEELRALRDRSGLTSGEAARIVGWHQSKISRIETGRSGVKPEDVRLLLDAYGGVGERERALLEALSVSAAGPAAGADTGRGRQWWHDYRGLLPQEYRDFISLEAGARSARTVELSVVPGLLQTPAYARAVTRAALGGLPEPKVDALVDVRLARQSVLRADPPLELDAVLDEAVLRRQIGGPEVMAEQLWHLVDVAALPHVRLQVLPFSVGGHLGLTGPFVIFSFPNIADLDVVVLDHLTSSLYLERKEDLEAYGAAFRTIQSHALPPQDSSELISGIAGSVIADGA